MKGESVGLVQRNKLLLLLWNLHKERISIMDLKQVEYPGRARINLVHSENEKQIIEFVKQYISEQSVSRSDRETAINALSQKIKHVDGNIVKTKDGKDVYRYNYVLENEKFDKEANPLEFVHTFISNFKALFHGIYHGVSIPCMDLFVEEYNWRYNHRTWDNNRSKLKTLIKAIFGHLYELQRILRNITVIKPYNIKSTSIPTCRLVDHEN